LVVVAQADHDMVVVVALVEWLLVAQHLQLLTTRLL
jgi:hypothetical protein